MKTAFEQLKESFALTFMDPALAQHIAQQHSRADHTNDKTPWQDWSDRTKWEPTIFIRADSWKPMPDLWPEVKPDGKPLLFGDWHLRKDTWPVEKHMRIYQKAGDRQRLGWAQFDKPIIVTILLWKQWGQWNR